MLGTAEAKKRKCLEVGEKCVVKCSLSPRLLPQYRSGSKGFALSSVGRAKAFSALSHPSTFRVLAASSSQQA